MPLLCTQRAVSMQGQGPGPEEPGSQAYSLYKPIQLEGGLSIKLLALVCLKSAYLKGEKLRIAACNKHEQHHSAPASSVVHQL